MSIVDREISWERFRKAKIQYRLANEELFASLKQLWKKGDRAQICYRGDYEMSCRPVVIVGVIDVLTILVKNELGDRFTVHPNDLYDE